ncbi:MAG: hypothetical protein H6Q59_1784 [Firmicutes bacterium]|nr:hypothetical protein [Bacillota bacterium]
MRISIRRILGTAVFIILSSSLLAGCGFNYVINATNRLDREDAKEFVVAKTEVSPITEISIHTGIAQVELIEADKFYVEIDYLYWEDEPEYSLENGKLFFDDRDCFPNSYSIDFNLDNRIKIYLPKDSHFDDINIEDASGDVSLNGFVADELDVTVSYGDFTMEEAAALDTEITLSSGYSKIKDFQARDLNFTNSYGNADFTDINTKSSRLPVDTTYDNFNIAMSSGDVDIAGINSSKVKITNSYGDIVLGDLTTDELELKLSSGNCVLTSGKVAKAYISNSYGNVSLNILGALADYSLDLDTSYGKIKVGENHYEDHYTTDTDTGKKIRAELSSGDVTIDFVE